MKRLHFGTLAIALIFCACGHTSQDAHHNHNSEQHEHHNHDGHNHSAHQHNQTENHTDHTTTSHEATSAIGHDDAIILSPHKASEFGVISEVVQPQSFRAVIPASGKIEAIQTENFTIVAPTSGIVRFNKTLVPGNKIRTKENLLNISASNLQEGDPVQRAKVAYETAQSDFERAQRLLEKRLISQAEYNAISERYAVAQNAYEALAKQHSEQGTAVVSYREGFVQECLVKEGEYVNVGQPLITATNQHALYLHADVAMRYFEELSNVESANFRPSYSETFYELETLGGKRISHGKALGENNHFIPVTFSMNGANGLIPGSCVEIRLLCKAKENVIAIPIASLTEEQGAYFVYIQTCSESYKKQEVKIGLNNGVLVEITAGLKPGDKVVTQGAYHVKLASATHALPSHSHQH